MHFLYNFTITLLHWFLPVSTVISKKMKLFVKGRKNVFKQLEQQLEKEKPVIWFHTASLGEYEQAVPVMEVLKKQFKGHQLVLTFFSPSGYENKKENAFAKATVYLPLDTPKNARKFLDIVKPEMAFFVKYEFWPNYLKELNRLHCRTFLLSGVFRKQQPFFKWYGRWMVSALDTFEYFFLQNEDSFKSLGELGFSNKVVSGDTRFDRVSRQLEMDNDLDFVEEFKENSLCVVCGSTWPLGENALTGFINDNEGVAKFIIAPHEIRVDRIAKLKQSLKVKTVLYSEMQGKGLKNYDVLIVDTIGLLTKVYSYADIAYVGGAMGGTGLHNILEPATFGVPILTGQHIDKFPEAKQLQQLKGLHLVRDAEELENILSRLLKDTNFRNQTGMITSRFINDNVGATNCVMEYLEKHS